VEDTVSKECPKYKLPSILTIEGVDGFAQAIKGSFLSQESDMQIDASAVENITTPAIQLIVAIKKSLLANNHNLIIVNSSDEFKAATGRLGLADLLFEGKV